MKKYIKINILLFIIFFIVLSCGEPPKEAKEKNLLEWISELIPKLNKVLGDRKAQKKLGKEIGDTGNIISFYKNSTIIIKSSNNIKSDFIYSIENNSFITKKGMYVTFADNQMFVSLDNNNWVVFNFTLMPTQQNDDEDIEKPQNFIPDYKIEHDYNNKENIIEVTYSIAFTPAKTMNTIKLNEEKKVYSLTNNMVLVNKNNNVTIDLKKNILYIPEDTIFKGILHINGNIVETKSSNGKIIIKSLKDIFIYAKNKMVSISFNRKKWSFSLFSLKFSPTLNIKSNDDKQIQFDLFVDLSYNE